MITLVLTNFDQLIGPTVRMCIPDDCLDQDLTNKLENFMDLDFGENIFEISLQKLKLRTFNCFIEFYSETARGHVESFLLSIAIDRQYDSTVIVKTLKEMKEQLPHSSTKYNSDLMQEKMLEIREKLLEIFSSTSMAFEDLEDLKQSSNYIKVLSKNIENLAQNISKKNEFYVKQFEVTQNCEGKMFILLRLKGQGFLTGPLKRVTAKNVHDGIEKYLLSNGIEPENFEIILK